MGQRAREGVVSEVEIYNDDFALTTVELEFDTVVGPVVVFRRAERLAIAVEAQVGC